MEVLKEFIRVGEKVRVPGITGPPRRVIAGVGDVPVHIDDTHREGQFALLKLPHETGEFILCIFPIATPPVTQCPPGNEGSFASKFRVVMNTRFVIMSISKKVKV